MNDYESILESYFKAHSEDFKSFNEGRVAYEKGSAYDTIRVEQGDMWYDQGYSLALQLSENQSSIDNETPTTYKEYK
tara:strand:- start:34 stop:264 length:231 start_codon:yes stop_codon:yes gene_type:complete